MRGLVITLLGVLLFPSLAGAEPVAVPAEFWLAPRSGVAVTTQPVIAAAVRNYLAHPGARVTLLHGRGDEAAVRAEELRAWFIALGVEADGIALRGGAPQEDLVFIDIGIPQ